MKFIKYIPLVLFLFLTGIIFSQTFGGKNAEWVYDFRGSRGSGITKLKIDGDTIVNGVEYQRISKTAIREVNGQVFTSSRAPFYIRQIGRAVLYTGNFTFEDTIFNFDAELGDSWRIPIRSDSGAIEELFFTFTVRDTFISFLNGIPVLSQEVVINNSMNSNFSIDTLFQDVGSRLSLIGFVEWPPTAVDDSDRGPLRCFNNDDLGVVDFLPYHLAGPYATALGDFEYDCDALTSVINGVDNDLSIEVYPNPSNSVLNVSIKGNKINQLSLYDLNGVTHFSVDINQNDYQLDVSKFDAGIYFLKINGSIFRKVVVIE